MIRRSKKNRLGTAFREPRGATQIEFVLSILTVIFVIFAIWEAIMAVYTYNVLSDAAKEGVRYAIVHGSRNTNCSGPGTCGVPPSASPSTDPTGSTFVVPVVRKFASASLHDVSGMTVTVTYPDASNAAPSRVQVSVRYNYIPYVGWAMPLKPLLKTGAEGRIVY